jgi:heptosyltransferase III
LRILVLRGGALGDFILTLPLLREIRNSYQEAATELWGIFPQARLATPAFVDRVERLDAVEIAPLFVPGQMPLMVRDRLAAFDLAISFLSDPEKTIVQNLAAAGVKRVIDGSCRFRPGIHAVYQLATVLDQLGLTLHDPVPRLSAGPNLDHSSCLGFHLGSGSASKNWQMDCWIELIENLDGLFDDFLLVGGEADNELVREFRSRCRIRRLRALLNANLSELSRALQECRLFVGHDTGVIHLAAAVGTASIALFGATDPAVWAPLGEHVRVMRSPDGLMESIGVAAVLREVRSRKAEGRSKR